MCLCTTCKTCHVSKLRPYANTFFLLTTHQLLDELILQLLTNVSLPQTGAIKKHNLCHSLHISFVVDLCLTPVGWGPNTWDHREYLWYVSVNPEIIGSKKKIFFYFYIINLISALTMLILLYKMSDLFEYYAFKWSNTLRVIWFIHRCFFKRIIRHR